MTIHWTKLWLDLFQDHRVGRHQPWASGPPWRPSVGDRHEPAVLDQKRRRKTKDAPAVAATAGASGL